MQTSKFYSTGYLALILFAALQMVSTVISLSQNVGYGQKISYLEGKKADLLTKKAELNIQLADQIAINSLLENEDQYSQISDVLTVKAVSDSLALR